MSTRIYDAFPADGGTLPTALATIKNASESCLRNIDTELNFQRETAPMADLIEKSVKQREAQSLIDENIEYQQQRLGLALENAVRLKAAYADFNSKKGELTHEKIQRQQKNFDSQSKALSKSIKNACASIIANKTVQAVFMSLSDGLSVTDYERLADPETIKNAAKDVEKSAAFKELMKNNSLEKLQALAKKPGEPGKKEEGIEQFCKDFRLTMVRQMNRKPEKPQTVKERVV